MFHLSGRRSGNWKGKQMENYRGKWFQHANKANNMIQSNFLPSLPRMGLYCKLVISGGNKNEMSYVWRNIILLWVFFPARLTEWLVNCKDLDRHRNQEDFVFVSSCRGKMVGVKRAYLLEPERSVALQDLLFLLVCNFEQLVQFLHY